LLAQILRQFTEYQDDLYLGVPSILGGTDVAYQDGTYCKGMHFPAQEARGDSEEAVKELDECLPIVTGKSTILVDGLDGGRTDRLRKRRVVLSPPPFEGMKRNSLRCESILVSG
jgi:hypothetical protein